MARIDQDTSFGRVAADRLGRLAPAAGAGAVEACPDAEVWAAYIDGGLPPAEVDALEAHLVTCPRCRQLVAALSPVDVAAELAPAAVPDSPARVLPFGRAALRRVLPLAAVLVAGVSLWLVLGQQNRESPLHSTMVAERVGSPAPAASPAAAADPAPSGSLATATPPAADVRMSTSQPVSPRKDRIPAGGDALTAQTARADARSADAQSPPRPVEPPAVAPARNVVAAAAPPGPTTAERARQEEARGNAEVDERKLAKAEAPAPAPSTPAAAPVDAPARAAATRAPAAPVATDALADTAAGVVGGVGGMGRRGAEAARDRAATAVIITFSEPEGRLRWRIVDGRRIESSSDGGATWAARFTDATAGLVAGSAPAIEAAWAVGARGLVLRLAVPGGWARVSRPTDQALVAVSASDAMRARVTAASGAVFETTDGGTTWRTAVAP